MSHAGADLPVLSCHGDRLVQVTFDEYAEPVTCDEMGECRGPHGTYLYVDHMRDTTFVEMELDFPTDEGSEVPIVATMREYRSGELVFESDSAAGMIQIVPPRRPLAFMIPLLALFTTRSLLRRRR